MRVLLLGKDLGGLTLPSGAKKRSPRLSYQHAQMREDVDKESESWKLPVIQHQKLGSHT